MARSLNLADLFEVVAEEVPDRLALASGGTHRTYGELDPLATNSTTTTYSLGSTLNAPLGGWQMTATVDASRAETNTLIDRNADNSALIAAAAVFAITIPRLRHRRNY